MIIPLKPCDMCGDYVSGQLGGAQYNRFKRHLQTCQTCREACYDLAQFRKSYAVEVRTSSEIRRKAQSMSSLKKRLLLRPASLAAAALLFASLLGGSYDVMHHHNKLPHEVVSHLDSVADVSGRDLSHLLHRVRDLRPLVFQHTRI